MGRKIFTVGKTVRFTYRTEGGVESLWTLKIRHAEQTVDGTRRVTLIRGMAESATEAGYRSFRTERIIGSMAEVK